MPRRRGHRSRGHRSRGHSRHQSGRGSGRGVDGGVICGGPSKFENSITAVPSSSQTNIIFLWSTTLHQFSKNFRFYDRLSERGITHQMVDQVLVDLKKAKNYHPPNICNRRLVVFLGFVFLLAFAVIPFLYAMFNIVNAPAGLGFYIAAFPVGLIVSLLWLFFTLSKCPTMIEQKYVCRSFELKAILDQKNVYQYNALGFSWTVGDYGAWISLKDTSPQQKTSGGQNPGTLNFQGNRMTSSSPSNLERARDVAKPTGGHNLLPLPSPLKRNNISQMTLNKPANHNQTHGTTPEDSIPGQNMNYPSPGLNTQNQNIYETLSNIGHALPAEVPIKHIDINESKISELGLMLL